MNAQYVQRFSGWLRDWLQSLLQNDRGVELAHRYVRFDTAKPPITTAVPTQPVTVTLAERILISLHAIIAACLHCIIAGLQTGPKDFCNLTVVSVFVY